MNCREFAEWLAYDRIDPWGPERADLRFAQLCALIVNMQRGKGSIPAKVSDFMFDFDQTARQPQSAEQMWATMRRYAAAHNAALEAREK